MEQIPAWEANQFSASQEIPRILWNLKVHYRIHKCPLPVRFLSQLDPVHVPTCHFLKIHLNVTFSSTPGSSKWFLSFKFPTKPLYALLPHTCYMPRPSHLDFIIHVIFGEEYGSLSSSLCSFLHSPSLLDPNILPAPYSQTPLAYFSPSIWATSFTPIQNNMQIIVLYTLIFRLQTGRQKILHRMIASIPWL
jgi:hypothetical protein